MTISVGGGGGGSSTATPKSYLDDFSTNLLGNYTFISGAASDLNVAANVMTTAANTASRKFVFPALGDVADLRMCMKWQHTARVITSSAELGFVLRQNASNNMLIAFVGWDGTNDSLTLQHLTAGAGANFAGAVSLGALAVATDYWLLVMASGNYFAIEHYTADPIANPGSAPVNRVEVNITTPLIHPHGAGAKGKCGFYEWTNNVGNTYQIDDLRADVVG